MIIRPFDENRDVDSLLELFQICFGKPMSKDYFEWKYTNNPFRSERHPVSVAEEDNRIIGACLYVFSRIAINGTVYIGRQGTNVMVHPRFRNRGIHSKIVRFADRAVNELGTGIAYGFPNDVSFRHLVHIGHNPIYRHSSHWKILDLRGVFNNVLHNIPLKKAGNILSPLLRYKTKIPKSQNKNVTVTPVNDMKILEDVYNKWKRPDKIYTVRDETYLNWRFKSHPEIEYQFFTAYVEEEVKGYFVISITEVMGMKRGTIVDYIVVDDAPSIFEPLLNYSLNVFKDNNCALADIWVFTQKWAQPIVKDYGFLSSRNMLLKHWFANSYIIAKPINKQNFPYDLYSIEWYITPSDSDKR